MQKPSLDTAPTVDGLTPYDREHAVTYLRLLDANAEGADWREVVEIVMGIDPRHEPQRARRIYETHLARAMWMANKGYRHLLRDGWPSVN
ncbi:DNA -binding domain-containing protein [Bradyrhizobium sp. ORS 111]|uniref:DNA -binding domain-containing protein n=1 Tax=Bradyrhizobium sp. ORS 111 TaxID=1685958 RepID=UPI00388DF07B